jgi:histidinol-phosphate aminotransferase
VTDLESWLPSMPPKFTGKRVSRRDLLRVLGATAVGATAARSVSTLAFAELPERLSGDSIVQRPILLDRNENAYGPSEKVFAAIRDAVAGSNRYARKEYGVLVSQIAALHNVKPEQVVLACGSSKVLETAVSEFLTSGKKLVQASPTFPLLGRVARCAGAEVVEVPLTETGEHDLDRMLAQARDSAGLIYICNPNNPTGTLTPRSDIEVFLHKLPANTSVLIDEAYHHFVRPHRSYASFLDQPVDDPRVIVTRTFSKIYGLAGLRVGYAVATPQIAQRFNGQNLRFGLSVIAARGAAAAIDDTEYVRLAIKRNADDRQEFMNQVNARMIHALDSQTNFVLINPLRDAQKVVDHLSGNGVIIPPPVPVMPKYVRVSLGTPSEMEEFWRVLDQLPVTQKSHM